MPEYKFKLEPTSDGWADIHISMPNPKAIATDLVGQEARARTIKFIMASAAGIAQMCGVQILNGFNVQEILHDLFTECSETIDYQFNARRLVLEAIRRDFCSPRTIEVNPPSPLTKREARLTVQALLDEGVVALDDRLKLVIVEASTRP